MFEAVACHRYADVESRLADGVARTETIAGSFFTGNKQLARGD
jgi:hypothetical protein